MAITANPPSDPSTPDGKILTGPIFNYSLLSLSRSLSTYSGLDAELGGHLRVVKRSQAEPEGVGCNTPGGGGNYPGGAAVVSEA